MQAMQFGDINRLAIEAKTPAEGRHQKANRDNAPAVVTGGGFADDDVIGSVQRRSLWP